MRKVFSGRTWLNVHFSTLRFICLLVYWNIGSILVTCGLITHYYKFKLTSMTLCVCNLCGTGPQQTNNVTYANRGDSDNSTACVMESNRMQNVQTVRFQERKAKINPNVRMRKLTMILSNVTCLNLVWPVLYFITLSLDALLREITWQVYVYF